MPHFSFFLFGGIVGKGILIIPSPFWREHRMGINPALFFQFFLYEEIMRLLLLE
jgi:hypothetical protein